MVQTLIKHGTERGYRAELVTGKICDRCRNGHRVFDRQYSAKGKREGIKYRTDQVLDHLYTPGKPGRNQSQTRIRPVETASGQPQDSPETRGRQEPDSGEVGSEQGLRDRMRSLLADGLSGLQVDVGNTYVEDENIPDYLQDAARDTPKDSEPEGDWSAVTNEEYVLSAADVRLIEENMGTYLSVVGMTLEILDPYCGHILGDNLENMVKRWTKVATRYPAASRLFMAKGGGVIMDWIAAIQATWPFLYALYEHHLAGTVKTDKGRVYRVTPNGSGPMPDSTSPVMDYDYTVS